MTADINGTAALSGGSRTLGGWASMKMCTPQGCPADMILVGAATGRIESCGCTFPAELRRIGMGIGSWNRWHPSR
jgi:hypothetical protein